MSDAEGEARVGEGAPVSRPGGPPETGAPAPGPAGSPAADRPPYDAVDLALLAAVGLTITLLLGHLLAFRYGRDQGIYAVVAEAMRHGGAPYRDAWDFKPPGIFAVYYAARALFGTGEHAVRVVEAASWASLVWAFAMFSRRALGDPKPGLVGGGLAVLTHVQLEFWHTGQPESFGAVAIAWALVAATYEPAEGAAHRREKRYGAWALAGALYAAAALLKPPLGGGFVVSLGFVVARRKGLPPLSRALPPLAAFAAGALVPLALTLGYFAAKGALGDLYQTLFVFTPHYTRLSFRGEWLLGFVFLAVEQWVFTFSAYNVFGFAFLLAFPALGRGERAAAWHVVGVVAMQLVGVALQAKFFPYHYGACLPLAGLLAGWGYWKLWLRVRRGALGIAGFALLAYVLHDARTATRDLEDSFWTRCQLRVAALFDPSLRLGTDDHLYSVADVNAAANRLVAQWLSENTPPSSSVYVWGFEPVLYDASGRRPASRYIYNVPQRVAWGRDEARRRLVDDLSRDPPAAVVVEHRDVFPFVTGDNFDSADSLRGFGALRDLVDRDYELVERIEDFDIYARRGAPRPGG